MRVPKLCSRPAANGLRRYYVKVHGRQVSLGTDESEARREYKLIVFRLNAGDEPTHRSIRLASVIARYLDWQREHNSEATYRAHERLLLDLLGRLPPSTAATSLRRGDVLDWVESHEEWGNGGRREAISSIVACLNWAVQRELIDRNPVAGIRRPAKGKRTSIVHRPTIDRILAAIDCPRFRDVVVFCLEQGVRPQELRTITAKHFDRRRSVIRLAATEHKTGRKTGRARLIYLTPTSLEIVGRLAREHRDGPIFRTPEGGEWTRDSVKSRFRSLERKHDLPRINIYTLRHTYITAGLAAGLSDSVVAELAGHADPSMVQRVYGHLREDIDAMREAARRLGR